MATPYTPPPQDEERVQRERMAAIGRSFFDRGLAAGSSGNMSLRLGGGAILATPTGSSFGLLTPESLSLLAPNGALLAGPKPTKEVFMHLACYAARPDAGAVVHLHSTYATAFSCLSGLNPEDAVPTLTPYGLMRYGRVALSPYRTPGSPLLGEDMSRLMEKHRAVLLANHGMVVTGKDITAAAYNAEELEESCRLHFILSGREVNPISPADQEELLRTKA